MYKFFVVAFIALIACAAAKPGIIAPLAYANEPLYAAGGSQQIDVRNNFDGTLSSYTTTPFAYAGPVSSRYVSGLPAVPAPLAAAPFAAASYAAAPFAAAPYAAAPFAAAPYVASPYAATPFAAPLSAAPAFARYAATPFATPFAAPAPLLV